MKQEGNLLVAEIHEVISISDTFLHAKLDCVSICSGLVSSRITSHMLLFLERCELPQGKSPLPSSLKSRPRQSYVQEAHAVVRRTAVGTIQRLLGQIR
jgi:hypothetical protein